MLRSLYGRIACVFAVLMLLFGAVLGLVYQTASRLYQDELVQSLNRGLASHIASHWPLIGPRGLEQASLEELFQMLMVVNPSIELYLVGQAGEILAHQAPPGHLKRQRIDLGPIRGLLSGAEFPLVGDDPRSEAGRKIFSVAPLFRDGRLDCYLYVILAGEDYQKLAEELWHGHVLRTAGWVTGGALLLTLAAGLLIFFLITRRLHRLTGAVAALERQDFAAPLAFAAPEERPNDEIGRLAAVFRGMAGRIAAQVSELKRQDRLRRELVANVSHDLRTPLTALHGYLETLQLKADSLASEERQRFLEVAVRQSEKVGRLAQELFELAKLECEEVQPQFEEVCLGELIQDVAQKFELVARSHGVDLRSNTRGGLPAIRADIGMIERVLTNLLDNAIRHTPCHGEVRIDLSHTRDRVVVSVADSGSGIKADYLPKLFDRNSPLGLQSGRTSGGLGLIIVGKILKLHGSTIQVSSAPGQGSVFRFDLPTVTATCS